MAGEYDSSEFIDTDFTAPKSPFAAPAAGGGSLRSPAPDEVNRKVVEAQQKLAELKRAQEELERERAGLEELRRRQTEFQTGRQEMIQQLTRGLGLLEAAEFAARRDAEQMAKTLDNFRDALAKVSARCGGVFSAHVRNEGDQLLPAIDELITVAKASGGPGHIYHFKQSGPDNWGKLDEAVARVEAARGAGLRITADMYPYTASATGLDAGMPRWVQDGGLEQWIKRLKQPEIRARVAAAMRDPHPGDWDNAYGQAGADGTLLLAFKNPALKPLTGKTLAEVARMRGKSPEETAMDLVVEDGSRVGVSYRSMSEANVRREMALPWMMFDSDEAAPAPEGVFLLANNHPRAYGSFARVLGRYARDQQALPLADAVRRLSGLPAATLSLKGRGTLKAGNFADIVVFDPATITDHATFERPHQLATGVSEVVVNGAVALDHGRPTGKPTGRVVHGRAWKGYGSGCRASPADWRWPT